MGGARLPDRPAFTTDVPLEQLPTRLAGAGRCIIVPGYRQAPPQVDVMRGEETQLLGAVALGQRNAWIELPGSITPLIYRIRLFGD